MRRVGKTALHRSLRRHGRRGALIFALLAILANQALLPAMHFAAGVPGLSGHRMAALCGGHGPADGDDQHGGIDHQACHFCRLIGAALPPPPNTLLVEERSAERGAPAFSLHDLMRPPEYFGTGHPARGPPSLLA